MSGTLFDDCEIWPVLLRFPDREGLTLWGSGGEEGDVVLATQGNVLLFRDPATLGDWVAQDEGSSLFGRPGYEELLALAADLPPKVWRTHAVPYRIDLFVANLARGAEAWNMGAVAVAVDALAMLWDLARTVEDVESEALLAAPGPLGVLADGLTFTTQADLAATLERIPWLEVHAAAVTVVERLVERCLFVTEEA